MLGVRNRAGSCPQPSSRELSCELARPDRRSSPQAGRGGTPHNPACLLRPVSWPYVVVNRSSSSSTPQPQARQGGCPDGQISGRCGLERNVIIMDATPLAMRCKKKNHKKSHFDVDTTLGGCTMATMSNRTIRISKASHAIITRWKSRTGLSRSRVADEAITLANQLWVATGFVLNGKKRKEGKQ